MKKLKEEVPSLKVHPPYNHFKRLKQNKSNSYDGDPLIITGIYKNGIDQMVSCKIEEADKFQETLSYMDHPYNFVMELEKWNCKQ